MFNAEITTNAVERSLYSKNNLNRMEAIGYYSVLDHGDFFYPAWKHYGRKTIVFCDRCNRGNLPACIGYGNFDLCLTCVNEMTRGNVICPTRHCDKPSFINDNSLAITQ
jgi:hypothetical protein